MSSITKPQLQHLAKLTSLKLSDEEIERLLPQMEQIIQFVGILQEVELDDAVVCASEGILETREGVWSSMDRDIFMSNVKHPITQDLITIETSTNQSK